MQSSSATKLPGVFIVVLFTFICTVLLPPLAPTAFSAETYLELHKLLGIPSDAPMKVIKKTYKKVIRELHPSKMRDATPQEKEKAKQKLIKITDAYQTLTDPKRKEHYYSTEVSNKNLVRFFLFKKDFEDGEIFSSSDILQGIRGDAKSGMIVFLWSRVVECIEDAEEYKKATKRLRGLRLRVGALQCDKDIHLCKEVLNLEELPQVIGIYPGKPGYTHFTGKYEQQLLVEFSLKYITDPKKEKKRSADMHLSAVIGMCPLMEKAFSSNGGMAMSQYFLDFSKKSYRGEIIYPFVYLEHSPCADCDVEIVMALENYRYYSDSIVPIRINCNDHMDEDDEGKLCAKMADGRSLNKAWTVMRISRICYYTTDEFNVFSNERCNDIEIREALGIGSSSDEKNKNIPGKNKVKYDNHVTFFNGRYNVAHFLDFLMYDAVLQAREFKSFHTSEIKQSNHSWVILFARNRGSISSKPFIDIQGDNGVQWYILSYLMKQHPLIGKKGWEVRLGVIDCSRRGAQCPKYVALPYVAVYSFGLKAKAVEMRPIQLSTVSRMALEIKSEMEPLHLHILNNDNNNNKKKKTSGFDQILKSRRKWLILFDNGENCLHCLPVRLVWNHVARSIQNSEFSKILSVGIFDCSKNISICLSQGVKAGPTIGLYIGDGKEPMIFDDDHSDNNVIVQWAIDAVDTTIQQLNYETLQKHLKKKTTILHAFSGGKWCRPCEQLRSVLRKVSKQFPKLMFSESLCEVDNMPCQAFNIDAIPIMMLFFKGKMVKFEKNEDIFQANKIVEWVKDNTGGIFS
eukprot:Tbor_TRINITY_DN5416_c0_g1::TRINITY_DN5416_c0_g1_i1::g.24985::m.24985